MGRTLAQLPLCLLGHGEGGRQREDQRPESRASLAMVTQGPLEALTGPAHLCPPPRGAVQLSLP